MSYSLQKRDRGDINVDKLSIGSRAKSKMADSPGPSSNNRDASSGTKKASSSASSPSELTRPVHLARISNRKSQSKGLPRQKKLERLAGYSMCTKVTEVQCDIGSFQKTSIPPPRRKLEVNPPTPFGCPNTFIIIRNNFVFPPPPDGRNFPRGGSVDLFWNDPF